MNLPVGVFHANDNSQPFRKTGLTNSLAASLLVKRRFAASHSSFPATRTAIAPRTSHSVNGPALLKFEHAGAPPLHARIQSRQCAEWLLPVLAPGERARNGCGNVYSAHLAPGNNPTPSPRPLVPRYPLEPTKMQL